MNDFVIVTDSATDLTQAIADKMNLQVLPLKFIFGEESYPDYLDRRSMDPKAFYDRIRNGALPTTSQVNVSEYEAAITPLLESGKDVLIIAISSALSGTYNSARIAKEELSKKFPNRTIALVDSKAASLGAGLIVYLSALEKEKGKTINEVYQFAEGLKPHLAHWFTVNDISHLKRGGRISGVAAFVAKAININPVLHVDDEGRLISRMKVVGRKKAIHALFLKMKETYDPSISKTVFISHGDDLEQATHLKDMIEKELDAKVELINFVGPVIGAHSGPGTIALFFTATNK